MLEERSTIHRRKIYDDELHAFFVTFSCYKRRNLLNADRAKAIVLREDLRMSMASKLSSKKQTIILFAS